jgi:hypothetical protein
VRTTWNTQIHFVGRTENFRMLKQMVHIVTTGLKVRSMYSTFLSTLCEINATDCPHIQRHYLHLDLKPITSWTRGLLEKLTVTHLVKEFPTLHGNPTWLCSQEPVIGSYTEINECSTRPFQSTFSSTPGSFRRYLPSTTQSGNLAFIIYRVIYIFCRF